MDIRQNRKISVCLLGLLLPCLVGTACITPPVQNKLPQPKPILPSPPEVQGTGEKETAPACKLLFSPHPKSYDDKNNYQRQQVLLNTKITSLPLLLRPEGTQPKIEFLDGYFKKAKTTELLILYFWAMDCESCVKSWPMLRSLFAPWARSPKTKVIAISESNQQDNWYAFVSDKKNTPYPIEQLHIPEGSSSRQDMCRAFTSEPYRPLVVAVDRDFVIQQALVFPFTPERIHEFSEGISRFVTQRPTIKKKAASWNLVDPASLQTSVQFRQWAEQITHLPASQVVRKLLAQHPAPGVSNPPVPDFTGKLFQGIYLLPLKDSDTYARGNFYVTADMLRTLSGKEAKDARALLSEPLVFRYTGPPVALWVDQKGMVRTALLGSLSEPENTQLAQTFIETLGKTVQLLLPGLATPPSLQPSKSSQKKSRTSIKKSVKK